MASESFKREFLDTHNRYRQLHSAPPLKLSLELSSTAQAWANHLLSTHAFAHSGTKGVGENLYFASGIRKPLTGKEAVDAWYSEIKSYDFSKPGFLPGTGHFTQVVWKSSTDLGVGLATDGHVVFVVGQYKPPGNVVSPGFFEKNVLPKKA